jgi:hypothetical protein
MRRSLIYAGTIALLGAAAAAQAPQFALRGDRFKPLVWNDMTPEQKTMTEHVLAGKRGSMNGP